MNNPALWRFDPKKHVIPADQIETKVVENDQWKNLHSNSWCPIPFNTIRYLPSLVSLKLVIFPIHPIL